MANEEDDEEEDIIYHGTDLSNANQIFAIKKFAEKDGTFFTSTRELAHFFACRTVNKIGAGKPALVKVALYRSDLIRWKIGKHVRSKGFDEGDAGELMGKTQLIFSREGVRLLNNLSFKNDWRVETMP